MMKIHLVSNSFRDQYIKINNNNNKFNHNSKFNNHKFNKNNKFINNNLNNNRIS